MKNLRPVLATILLSLLITSPIFAQVEQVSNAPLPGDVIWADNFDGTGVPDPTKWEQLEYNRRINENGPDGWWKKEDSYLDGNGNLIIRTRRIEDGNDDGDSCDFSCGAIRTKNLFEQLYGKFEIRCKLPTQPGWWVAFWMMQGDVGSVTNGGVDGTEVDIFEGFGWTDHVQHAFHWDGYGSEHQSIGHGFDVPNIREGFHTFAMEWYPEQYVFFIDGEETWRSTGGGVCNQPGYIKITGELYTVDWAIGPGWANHPKDAVYPDSLVVDYVRVYELGDYVSAGSLHSTASADRFKLFPNPAKENIHIHWDQDQNQEEADVSIFDSSGRMLKSFPSTQSNTELSVSDLSSGIYFISMKQGKTLEYHKFLKE